jgi:hypothetical protein
MELIVFLGTLVKGKRGRKAGTGKKQMAAETENTVMEDWTGGKGDPEKCAHEECKRPKEMSINWVQCDDCDGVSPFGLGIFNYQNIKSIN